VNAVAHLAELANHHPDIDIRYTNVTLSLVTHDQGGITDKDVNLAREIEEAQRLRSEAEALLAQYRQKQAAAETEAQSILAEARAEAERFGKEARAAAAAQIARRAKQAEEKIAQAEAHALADIRAAAADAAVAAAEKIIIGRLDQKEAANLVRRSLTEIPERLQ